MDDASTNTRPSSNNPDVVQLIADFEMYTSYPSFADIVKGALRFMADRLQCARASVALLRNDGDGFMLFDATVDVAGVESGRIVPHGSATLSETVAQCRSIYRADIRAWLPKNPVDEAFIARGFLCTFSVPLLFAGQCRGTLNCASVSVDGIDAMTRRVIELVAPKLAYASEMGLALDALAQSEARFRHVFDSVGDGISVADVSNRRLVMVNAPMWAMLGRPPSQLPDLTIEDIHPADHLAEILATFQAMARGEIDHAREVPLLRADGTVLLADATARSTFIGNKPCVVAVFRDATVRRQREEEQLQIQKLESIRTLAAGIAHDFNNLLTGLVGNVSLAQMQLEESTEPWQLLDEAQRAAARATALTRQLLTFAKGGTPLRARVGIVQLVREAAGLAVAGTNAQCQFEPPNERLMVLGDEGQLAQVIQNLVRNAVDAMPAGGTIRLQVDRRTDNQRTEICIQVSDQGAGIAPEVINKIFVPFFTTKKGRSGLGLAVAYSIINNHGGRIQVSSQVGSGTTFSVRLPPSDSTDATPEAPQVHHHGNSGRVLIMDDESIVLQVSERALHNAGYDTRVVTDGQAAIGAYREALETGQRFDAVVLDLTVPGGMGGKAAAQQILVLDPRARLMVSSGYSDDAVMANFKDYGFCAVLPKPYGAQQLCDAIHAMIAGHDHSIHG